MPNECARQLRELCAGYPRSAIVDALGVAVADAVSDSSERQPLALLLASWLSDEDGAHDPPPIDDAFVQAVERALRARAH
jgi:hypothetical protein